jgi:hypothetical protein
LDCTRCSHDFLTASRSRLTAAEARKLAALADVDALDLDGVGTLRKKLKTGAPKEEEAGEKLLPDSATTRLRLQSFVERVSEHELHLVL